MRIRRWGFLLSTFHLAIPSADLYAQLIEFTPPANIYASPPSARRHFLFYCLGKTTTKKTRIYLLRGIVIAGTLFLILAGVALSNARIELTEAGVHQRLLIPLGFASAGIHTYAGTGDKVKMAGFLDGPIVRRKADGGWTTTWYCEDKVQQLAGKSAELSIDCAGQSRQFPVSRSPSVPNAVFETPEDTVIMSDIEGNTRFLDAALAALEVTDVDGNWRHGRKHLVIAGDAVDRGRDVLAVLWRLYALSLQAQDAGGAVHVLLGNQ
ncbi:hypothetical protein [Telluria aromaticivorans]|uniref:Calcineurin-like phosphoesterase domain-containing protein n=1 Tax=Telluria aromaticivorans TaxID=2725995 RepID=A0A7Y2P3D5_9BURK|nr:hypothetical protein [Telluria aromaticivorans]NNG25874.1 hypothetical protein [Telluria aromaticivorans]